MGSSSSQRRTDPPMSLIHAFPVEEMYMPQFSDYFQENTSYSQEPNREESLVEALATSPPKTKKPTRARQKRMIQSDDAPRKLDFGVRFWRTWKVKQNNTVIEQSGGGSKRYKSYGSSTFNTESGVASINLNTNVGDNDEDEGQEIRRQMGRDKARDAAKKRESIGIPYDHLTKEQRMAMKEARAEIKAKYKLPY
ncbi:hypothetical protein Tco_1421692 [Tanacetum coccineum]